MHSIRKRNHGTCKLMQIHVYDKKTAPYKNLTTKAAGLFNMFTKGISTSVSFLADSTMAVCTTNAVRSLASEGC